MFHSSISSCAPFAESFERRCANASLIYINEYTYLSLYIYI